MVRPTSKTNNKTQYQTNSFPDSIQFDGNTIFYCRKNPNFAEYMLPKCYMNRSIFLSKSEWVKHCMSN